MNSHMHKHTHTHPHTHTHTHTQPKVIALLSSVLLKTSKNALDGTNLFERVIEERGALQDNVKEVWSE